MTQSTEIIQNSVNEVLERELLEYNQKLATKLNGECIYVNSSILPNLEFKLYSLVHKLKSTYIPELKFDNQHLIVMLQTPGGVIGTVERLVDILRANYQKVSFVIPNYAYSAGTVFALSGNNIYMNYFSVLGPIDPQIQISSGQYVSGQGILYETGELMKKINNADSIDKARAEITLLTDSIVVGVLFEINQAISLGTSLIIDWLPKYKFKDWNYTQSQKKKVTLVMKKRRARSIAEKLGDSETWYQHGRGITIDRLRQKDIKLQIDDFGEDKILENIIIQYYYLSENYFNILGKRDYLHSRLGIIEV